MKRHLDHKELIAWRETVGGLKVATILISEALECSISKAEKLASCRYPNLISPAEQMALASRMNRPRDVVFPCSKAKAKRAS